MSETADLLSRLDAAVVAVRERTDFVPLVGIVLGTELGALAHEIEPIAEMAYGDLPVKFMDLLLMKRYFE